MAEATIDSGTLHALIDETKAARDHYKWDIAKGEGTMCESSKVEHEYASKGVAGRVVRAARGASTPQTRPVSYMGGRK